MHYEVVLMRENRAQIEFETFISDIADGWRTPIAQPRGEIDQGTILGSNVDCN